MDAQKNTFSEVVNIVKSWIHWTSHSDPVNESRDHEIPGKKCTPCYGCGFSFAIFNRRHHCGYCGKPFCAGCSENLVPTPSCDQRKRVHLCNFCYKQWEQGLISCNNSNQVLNHEYSLSPSLSSYVSMESIPTVKSTTSNTGCSTPALINPYQQEQQSMSLHQSPAKVKGLDREILAELGRDFVENLGKYSKKRGGDSARGYSLYRSVSEMPPYSGGSSYYGRVDFGGINNIDGSQVLVPQHFDMQGLDQAYVSSADFDADAEPLDFENNGLLWLPPDPEDDEEYGEEHMLFDDEDDDYRNHLGEWGYMPHSPSSLESGESGDRDRSGEGPRKSTSNVVDEHFRALIAQLLLVENLPVEENDSNSWFEIISTLSWEAATLLKPDMSHGGGMDPSEYVKVKCIACGKRSESVVVKGVVCKKNVAHRRMKSKLDKPRLLILGGAIEYQRVTTLLTSVDTLLQQEMDHLKMVVAKIVAQKPDILLVEKSVSRYAQEYLLAKGISLVLNVGMPLLERIARCTATHIAPSVDHIKSLKLGSCETFRVEKFVEDLGCQEAKKSAKTLMFFEGCPKPLGFTILLQGADMDELKKAKQVVKYGIFAAYHLAVETSFLADEGVSRSEFPLNGPIPVPLPDKSPIISRSISTVTDFIIPSGSELQEARSTSLSKQTSLSDVAYPDMTPGPSVCHSTTLSRYSSDVSVFYYEKPLASEVINKMASKIPLITENSVDSSSLSIMDDHTSPVNECWPFTPQNSQSQLSIRSSALDLSSIKVSRSFKETEAASEEKLLVQEEFPASPADDQDIILSMSSRCVWKGTVCVRPHLCRIVYYRNSDKPLGRFLRDYLFDQSYHCNSCEMPSEAHVHSYTHGHGNITISVKKLPETFLPGEKDGKIWMWHRCLKCPRMNGFPPATHRIIMSDAAWGLSLGKFLELSFSNHAAASRVAGCGHSLHRDCLRFYGFGNMVACFRYTSIEIYSVFLPLYKLDFDCGNQEWIQKESEKVANQAELLFSEVLNALREIENEITSSTPINSELEKLVSSHLVAELQGILLREKDEFEEALHKILNQEKRKGQPGVDILEINQLWRQLFFQSYMWDRRLIYASKAAISTKDNDLHSSNYDYDKARIMDEKEDIPMLGDSSNADCTPTDSAVIESPEPGEEGSEPVVPTDNVSETLDELFVADSLSSTAQRDHAEDHQNMLMNLPKGHDKYMEDSLICLGMPFVNFYRSFNKNIEASAQKLDALADYNPSYVSTLSSFREMELRGEARLLLPVSINDTVIPVFDDEPSSIIAYALMSSEYHTKLNDELERTKDGGLETMPPMYLPDTTNPLSFFSTDETISSDSQKSFFSADDTLPSFMHPRVSFGNEGPHSRVKYSVTVYYAKLFDAMRRVCDTSETDYVRSLSRCKKWGAKGGKSNVFFAKTLDDRFIIKQVIKTELESFIKFCPAYCKYISDSIMGAAGPSCFAKILGVYQVTVKHPKGGKESKMDVLVMENLMFRRNVIKLYDLKGSSRARYNSDSTGTNKVLLDQNLIESIPNSPIYLGNKAKRLLLRAVWNDTNFLAKVGVMDYSLLLGIDQENHELVVGIIDYMRQYTWDKHLETWVKASGILGGPTNSAPTVVSPMHYKKRFRKAISFYFYMLPDQWSVSTWPTNKSQPDTFEDNTEPCPSVE